MMRAGIAGISGCIGFITGHYEAQKIYITAALKAGIAFLAVGARALILTPFKAFF